MSDVSEEWTRIDGMLSGAGITPTTPPTTIPSGQSLWRCWVGPQSASGEHIGQAMQQFSRSGYIVAIAYDDTKKGWGSCTVTVAKLMTVSTGHGNVLS